MMDFTSLRILPEEEEEEDQNDELLQKILARRERRIIVIKLDNNRHMAHSKDPRPVFHAGEEVSGMVTIEIIGEQPVKQVLLILKCLIQTRWSSAYQPPAMATAKRRKSIFADYFSGATEEKEIFFDRQKIFEIDLLNPEKKLNEGKHELPFRFMLPKGGLPSSMKSCNGLIKYTIEAFTIDEENSNESRGEKEIIFLVPILDLKQISRKAEKLFNMDDGSGEIEVNATLDRKIFTPGDWLSLQQLSIRNDTDRELECRLSIYQRQTIIRSSDQDNKQQTYEYRLNASNQNKQQKEPYEIVIPIEPNESKTHEKLQIHLPVNLVLSLVTPFVMVNYFALITIYHKSSNEDNQENQMQNIPASSDRLEIPFLVSLMAKHHHQHH